MAISNSNNNQSVSPKSGVVTLLLCLFLGVFGAHRFYVGKVGTGILMLITAGGLGIWSLIDLVRIACCDFTDKENRYIIFRREASRTKTVFTVLGLLLVALAIYIFAIVSLVLHLTGGMVEVITVQLNAMKQGDQNKAYSLMAEEFRKDNSVEVLEKYIAKNPILVKYVSFSCPDRQMENNQGYVACHLKSETGEVKTVEYMLVKENGSWKIVAVRIKLDAKN